jgi:hypothetical protein
VSRGTWSAHLRIDQALWTRFAVACRSRGIDRSEWIRARVTEYTEQFEQEEGGSDDHQDTHRR